MDTTSDFFVYKFGHMLRVNWSATVWILVLTLITVLVAMMLQQRRNRKPKGKRIPGPKVHPIITTLIPLINILRNNTASNGLLMFQTVCGYSHVFRKDGMWLFWGAIRPILMLYKPETVEAVLSSNEILEKGFEYDLLKRWLKEGLLTSKGNKWRYRRRLLTPAFHFRILDEYIPVFNEQAKVFGDKIAEAMRNHQSVNIAPLASLCTLDIICETAMGKRINAQEYSTSPYVQALHSTCKYAVDRLMKPWLWPEFIYFRTAKGKAFKKNLEIMDKFTRQVISERKQERQKTRENGDLKVSYFQNDIYDLDVGRKRTKRLALLDLLLEAHFNDPNFTLEDIAEEVDNFMFAGHDTTSSGLSWALYMLGLYPKIQKRAQEEVDEVLGEDFNKVITTEDIKDMKYLDCILKETRRLFPPTPFIARELPEDTYINDILIPKGTNCGILIYMLHRDPDVFSNPEVFDPERFTLENSTGRHPYAYVPFSAGPRNCIGQRFASFEALTVMATILRRFDMKSLLPLDKMFVVDELVIRSENGMPMSFTPRETWKDSVESVLRKNGFSVHTGPNV